MSVRKKNIRVKTDRYFCHVTQVSYYIILSENFINARVYRYQQLSIRLVPTQYYASESRCNYRGSNLANSSYECEKKMGNQFREFHLLLDLRKLGSPYTYRNIMQAGTTLISTATVDYLRCGSDVSLYYTSTYNMYTKYIIEKVYIFPLNRRYNNIYNIISMYSRMDVYQMIVIVYYCRMISIYSTRLHQMQYVILGPWLFSLINIYCNLLLFYFILYCTFDLILLIKLYFVISIF